MKIHAIDYKKHFWNDWTVYRQCIKIDNELMNKYNDTLQKEYDRIEKLKIHDYNDMNIQCYTKKLEKWINFLHLTWLYYFRNTVLENKIDDKNRSILDHCDTQVRDRVYAQLDKYSPMIVESKSIDEDRIVAKNSKGESNVTYFKYKNKSRCLPACKKMRRLSASEYDLWPSAEMEAGKVRNITQKIRKSW